VRNVRRVAALVATVATAAIAPACGSDSAGSGLDEALGYLPKDAPLVITVSTDVEGERYEAARNLLQKIPFSNQFTNGIEEGLKDEGLNYADDIKPLLGNDLVIGAPTVEAAEQDRFIGAWQVRDADKLEEIIKNEKTVKEIGESGGATLYQDDDTFAAVKDDVVVFADSREDVEAALERAAGDQGLDSATMEESLGDLAGDPLVRVFGDIRALLSTPDAAQARRVKWVAALETFGVTADVTDAGVEIDYAVKTNPDGLTDEDLPLAAGAESPRVIVRKGEAATAIRDLSRLFRFAESAGEAADPEGFADFEREKARLEKDLGIDIDRDLIDQLSGELSATQSFPAKFAVRAELRDPKAFEATLAKLADGLPRAQKRRGEAPVTIEKPKGDERLYALVQAAESDDVAETGDIRESHGTTFYAPLDEKRERPKRLVFGVVDGVFVAAQDPKTAGEIAAATPTEIDGVEGAAVSTVDAGALAQQLIAMMGSENGDGSPLEGLAAGLVTRSLGDLTSSLEADTSGLRGKVRLEVK